MNSRKDSGLSIALHERMLRSNLEAFLVPVLGLTETMAILCNVSFQNGATKVPAPETLFWLPRPSS